MSLGSNIRKIRESKNITIDQMVKRLATFKSIYLNIEKDLVRPTPILLKKISNIFGLSEKDIINYNENIAKQQIRELNLKNLKDVVADVSIKIKNTKSLLTPITKTPINVVLEDLSIREVVYKKPILLTSSEIFQIGNKIKTVEVKNTLPNDTFINSLGQLDPNLIVDRKRSFSSSLLNWVEPYVINGIEKTLFYTEINTGLKVGDRVFIVNGNYDSNEFIKINKYKRKTDGYIVLFVDNCKVVLDIDYEPNKLPYSNEPIDNFINVYYIERKADFLQANRQVTSRGGDFDYKFNKNQNNIIYVNSNFDPIVLEWGQSLGINQPGFYVKDGNSWTDITSDFITGSFSIALSLTYNNNGKIKIHNGSFTHQAGPNLFKFTEGLVYKWDSDWVVDNSYNKPYITKSNFRDGHFNGIFNSGVFGTQNKQIKWDNSIWINSIWNTGILLNTNWISGKMNSINSLPESYISEFDNIGKPYQKLNAPNNNGRGFNYIDNSNIENIEVDNGIFSSSIIGQSATYSIIENHIKNDDTIFNFNINKGIFDNCYISGGYIKESEIENSRVLNTRLENIKSINSNYKLSLIKDSIYISDDVIKIIGYDEFTIAEKTPAINTYSHKVYKFYISEDDYKKIKIRDRFYIKGLSIKDNSKYPLNFFERRFRVSSWTEYFDSYKSNQFTKLGVEVGAFLSTSGDNDWKLNYIITPQVETVVTEQNNNNYYSIDIVVSTHDKNGLLFTNDGFTNELPIGGLAINKQLSPSIFTSSYSEPPSLGDNVDISNAYVINSDFESGIIENTDWVSGYNINYNNDVNLVEQGNNFGEYSIIANTQSSQLIVETGHDPLYKESGDDCLEVGNIVFLNNVEYESPNGDITKLGDSYKIASTFNNDNELTLTEIGTNILSTITQSGGTFSTSGAQNRYNYIFKSKIDKSKIISGIFRRSYIKNSFIENETYDINDKNFNNISKIKDLIISDSIFKNNTNILSKALYMNSSFVEGDDKFENGIVYNSIWNGLTFSKGVFKESRWVDGIFNNGEFYNNRSFDGLTTSNTPLFNNERVKSYYKDGQTSNILSNNRYSWQDGEFNNGDFFESDWENGEFNGGKFYYSKFYNGNINGGFVGDYSIPINNTMIYNGVINFTTVQNAKLLSSDNSSGSTSSIIWNDGVFNSGEFGSDNNNIAIWKGGTFNGGNFDNLAIWEDGIFNGGNFISTFGWTMSDSSSKDDYSWQDGTFNGGQFGNASGASNSTWFTGEFNGGKFVGRVWNDGLLTNGEFNGSGTYSPIRGVTATESNALLFTDSFTSSYYGLWRDGIVSNKKDKFIKDKPVFSISKRVTDSEKEDSDLVMSNFLWESGTFSHSSGFIEGSVWLNGTFERGTLIRSSFNPYVKRNGSTQSSFELSDSCYWINGNLFDSDFYISKWEKGKFDTGDAYGMIWKDGICNYMNAFNIFWEKGLWKNGNWHGSYMNYNGTIEDDFYQQILARGISWSGTQSMHVWNIFDYSLPSTEFSSASASAITLFQFGFLDSID